MQNYFSPNFIDGFLTRGGLKSLLTFWLKGKFRWALNEPARWAFEGETGRQIIASEAKVYDGEMQLVDRSLFFAASRFAISRPVSSSQPLASLEGVG